MTNYAIVTYEPTEGYIKSVNPNPEVSLQDWLSLYAEPLEVNTTGVDEEGNEVPLILPVITPHLGTIVARMDIPNADTAWAVLVEGGRDELSKVPVELVNITWRKVNIENQEIEVNPVVDLKEIVNEELFNDDLVVQKMMGNFLLDTDEIYEEAQNKIIDNLNTSDFNSLLENKRFVEVDGVLTIQDIPEEV